MTPEEAIPEPAVLIVGIGTMAEQALDCARALGEQGIEAIVVSTLWVLPVQDSLVELARRARMVAVVEDGAGHGGVGGAIDAAISARGLDIPLRRFALPQAFIAHGSRADILHDAGLDGVDIAERLARELRRRQE